MPTRRRSDERGAAPAAERERDRRCCGASEVKPIIRRLARWIGFGLLAFGVLSQSGTDAPQAKWCEGFWPQLPWPSLLSL
jgi:hypothetical protein